jgi:excisionase family DNA binding protein
MRTDASQPADAADPAIPHASSSTMADDRRRSGGDVTRGEPTAAIAEVIDVATVAQLLCVGRNTVYAMVARNEIPHRRMGKQIRFSRAAIMRWLASWSLQGAKEGQ